MAVTAVDNTNGAWQYSVDGGSSWTSFTGTTGSSVDISANARLLDGTASHVVRFVPDGDFSGTATITFKAWDKSSGVAGGTADASASGGVSAFSSAQNTASISVTPVNDAPAFTGLDATPGYTEGGTSIVLDGSVAITDPDLDELNGGNGDYTGATLSIARDGGVDGTDTLSVGTGGNLTVAGGPSGGGTISASGHVIATMTDTGAGQLQIDFVNNGTTPTTALVGEVMQAIRYANTSDDAPAVIQLNWSFSDGNSGNAQGTGDNPGTSAGSVSVMISGINQAPILTATGGNPTYTEGAGASDLFNSVTANTVERGDRHTSLTLTVTNLSDGANEILSLDGSDIALTNANSVMTATNGLSVSVSVVSSTATVSFSGANLSDAQLQTLVDGMTYRNSSDDPTAFENRVVTITSLSDNGGTANGGNDTATLSVSSTVSITATNDAPVVANLANETSNIVVAAEPSALSVFANVEVRNADAASNSGFLTIEQTSGTMNGIWSVDGTIVSLPL
ncbi:MAG: hypothetical protein AB8B60_02065 [Sulfitobacter sp.]